MLVLYVAIFLIVLFGMTKVGYPVHRQLATIPLAVLAFLLAMVAGILGTVGFVLMQVCNLILEPAEWLAKWVERFVKQP